MNIQSSRQINFEQRHQKVSDLQKKLSTELSGLEDQLLDSGDYTDGEMYRLDAFLDSQRVSTYEERYSNLKTAGRVVTGAIGGALLGYQGGLVGSIGNGALAAAGMTFASIEEGAAPDLGEVLTGGVMATAVVALPGHFGGIPGAVGGAIAGGLAAIFGGHLLKS